MSPGRTKYEAITLDRGVTHDTEFEKWANKVWNFGSGLGAEVSLKDFRKDLIIEVYNEAGQKVIAYLEARVKLMDYGRLRKEDLVIATGVVEGAARYVVGERLDNSGMRWIEESLPASAFTRSGQSAATMSAVRAPQS